MSRPSIDLTRWTQVPGGWVHVPPPHCPRGHVWATDGPTRPQEGWTACLCTADRGHTLWTCRTCSVMVADGCTDVTRWAQSTTRAGSTLADRAAWRR